MARHEPHNRPFTAGTTFSTQLGHRSQPRPPPPTGPAHNHLPTRCDAGHLARRQLYTADGLCSAAQDQPMLLQSELSIATIAYSKGSEIRTVRQSILRSTYRQSTRVAKFQPFQALRKLFHQVS